MPKSQSGPVPQIVPSDEPFLTAQQVAERLHVKRNTIYEWFRNGNPIPHYPISKKVVLFRWSEVVAWVEKTRRAA